MSENKEDIDLLSQKELEDGEIEEGELDEPECMSTVDIEPEVLNTDILDDSDVNIGDKNVLKNKKHKHHKKCHKRHMNLEEKVDSKWKRSKKSVDECDGAEDSPKIIDSINIIDSDSCENETSAVGSFQSQSKTEVECDKVKSSVKWGNYESEDEVNSSNNFNNIEKSISFNEKTNKRTDRSLSPAYEVSETDREVPVITEVREICKWNDYDSDNEATTSTSAKIDFKRNPFDENQNSKTKVFKSWDSGSKINTDNRGWENDDNRGWENNVHITNSPTKSPEYGNSEIKASSPISKAVWGSYDSPRDEDKVVKNDNANSSPLQNTNNNFGKWGSYNSPEKETGNFQKWGSVHSPKGTDDDNKWGSRDSPNKNEGDFKKWGSRDSPKRDDNYQRWGSRDGSRRNNYRRWGPRDGSRRNNTWRRGPRDGSYRNNDNQKWGSSNNDSPQRYNDDKSWGANNGSPQRSNEKRWGNSPQRNNDDNKKRNSSNSSSPQRGNDGSKKWGSSNNGSPQRNNDDKKWGPNNNESPLLGKENINQNFDLPEKAKWGSYDSDDDQTQKAKESNETVEMKKDNQSNSWNFNNNQEKSKWDSQNSPKANNNVETTSGFGKWGAFDSDEEDKSTVKENSHVSGDIDKSNKPSWKSFDSDDESKGTFNENKNKGNYNNNSSWNKNDKGDFKNDRNKRWSNRNDGEKRNVCKYFSMGSCRHGDRCTFLHESPTKPISQEVKKKELCKFYEHQQCYKRNNCIYMHEEFPCKLFHAGSKMCPSGDSCKYSHAPLNQETRSLLEKYLDEKVDERTDKNASEWSSIIKKSAEDDLDDDGPVGFEQPDSFFPDPVRYRYPPGGQDLMRFPVRPWNSMMRYNEMSMQFPHQMEFMHRQRFMCQYPMNAGRIFPRGFRGMVPPNIHEGFSNGMPYSIPPLMQTNPKLPADMKDGFNMSDPFIDNLAQLVVGKDLPTSPKRLVDMLDPNMQCEDIDDFSLEIETNNSKKNLLSPVVIKSPEIPPGAYVPRTSMNAAQPNVRLGPGPAYGGEQAMMYGGYPAHPGDPAMMDYINMSAIHYFHNHTETMGYDVPWKLILLEVPIKIPYPLMVIETQDLLHKYTDPRLKGHPSVMNSNNATDESTMHQNSYDFNTISSFGSSSLPSPNFITASSESSETLTPLNDFLPKSDDPESPMFPIGEEIFNFKQKLVETERISDRSYLQDPRFKRKKVIVNTSMDPSDME